MNTENKSEMETKLATLDSNEIPQSKVLPDGEVMGRLDSIYSLLEGFGEMKSLAEAEHDLKITESDRKHCQREKDSKLLTYLKISLIIFTFCFVASILSNLYLFFHGYHAIDAKTTDWHVTITIIISSFTSAFAALALLIKGVFQSEKDDNNFIPSLEALKEVTPLIKDLIPARS